MNYTVRSTNPYGFKTTTHHTLTGVTIEYQARCRAGHLDIELFDPAGNPLAVTVAIQPPPPVRRAGPHAAQRRG